MTDRILVVTRHFWPENCRINELCSILSENGYRVDVLCGQPSAHNGEFYPGYGASRVRKEKNDNITIYRTVDVKQGNKANLRIFLNYFTYPFMAHMEVPGLSRNSYCAVFIYQTSPVMICSPGLRIARRCHIPVYIYTAELWPQSLYPVLDVQSTLFRRLLFHLSMHYYRKADRLLVPSARIRSWFQEQLGLSTDHFSVVPGFPDPDFEQEYRDDDILERLAASFNLVLFGDFGGRLAVDTVIQVAEQIRADHLWKVRFVVIGSGGKIMELADQAELHHLEDYFFFEGDIPSKEYGKYIHITDIVLTVVHPADMDEFQIPEQLISYLAVGRPMIVSLSGEVKKLIKEAGCGISVEPYDVRGISDGIRSVMKMSETERQQMGTDGRDYGIRNYNARKSADKILAVIQGREEKDADSSSEIKNLWDI